MSTIRQRLNSGLVGIAVFGVVCLTLPGKLSAQEAADTFNKKCAVCHGKDGMGKTAKGKKAHVKPVSENMKNSEDDQIKVVEDGKGDDMDGYKKDFSADQIKALVEYYRSLAPK